MKILFQMASNLTRTGGAVKARVLYSPYLLPVYFRAGNAYTVFVYLTGSLNMFPRLIYQLLPYLYFGLGLLCILIADSPFIFLSAALFIAAGWLVMWMRHRNLVDPVEYIKASKVPSDKAATASFSDEKSSPPDYERRSADQRSFPLIDNSGGMIAFNRRMC